MIPSSNAIKYARGLLGATAPDADLRSTSNDLSALAGALGHHLQLRDSLANSAIPIAKKQEIVAALVEKAQAPELIRALVAILLRNGDFALLSEVAEGFRRVVDERFGIMRADVRFARPADDAAKQEVAAALSRVVGGKVAIDASVDPTLVGGFVARVGDLVFDGSLTRQLDKLRSTLLRS